MGPRLLTRRCVGDCLRQAAFFLAAYLALISIAMTAPLIRGGAPLGAVIAFLPDQMALPATLALPLALVTGILVTIGRMREDGELIALQAAGVSNLRVALALLSPALATALLAGLMAHLVLPDSFQRWREGKSSLLRQAVATKVAQREFLYQDDDGTALAAHDVDGDVLRGLFARHAGDDGELTWLYAPRARWVAVPDARRDSTTLHLQLEDARLLGRGADGDITGGTFPSLVVHLEQPNPVWSSKADTKPTALLGRTIAILDQGLTLSRERLSGEAFLGRFLQRQPLPLDRTQIASWPRLLDLLTDPGEVAILRHLARDLGPALNAARRGDADAERLIVERLNQGLAGSVDDPAVLAALPPSLRLSALADARSRSHAGRFALDLAAQGSVVMDPTSRMIELVTNLGGKRDLMERLLPQDIQEDLRTHQMVWHLRWLMALLPLSYWLFACGLALSIPAGNRLLAVCIALAMVLATLLPGIGLAKNSEGLLAFNPGWVMWGCWLALGASGCWMLWRRR